jgi:uncharacterized protein YprB with RNaseH-like and TPR domain
VDDKLRQRLSELGPEPREGEVRHARARSSRGRAGAEGRAGAPRPGGGGIERIGDIETPGSRERLGGIEDLGGVVRDDGILVIDRSVSDLTSRRDVERVLRELEVAAGIVESRDDTAVELRAFLGNPRKALFIDTETTGLAGSMVFLLGAMRITGDDIRLVQVLARDYAEEKELAALWSEMLGRSEMLVSFNGKSFDVPVLRDRMGLHKISPPAEPPHLDLLHHSRRRWKGEFPDCRLQTLEWHICGRRRIGDIPGEEIPAVYHHYVRTGEIEDMFSVFHHNALDLITLVEIALALVPSQRASG